MKPKIETEKEEEYGDYMSRNRDGLCDVHAWDSSVFCDNIVKEHTLTYLPAYKESVRTSGDTETVSICDECWWVIGCDGWGHVVKTANNIETRHDVVIK